MKLFQKTSSRSPGHILQEVSPLKKLTVDPGSQTHHPVAKVSLHRAKSQLENKLTPLKEVSYSFKYPELRGRPGSEPWTIRMTSVYSSIDHPSERSCWIVLHPMYQSRAESRLLDYLAPERKEQPKRSTHQPLVQHVLLVSTYLTAWRDYLLHYENELLTLVGLDQIKGMHRLLC
jgi:hypothetical protein